MINEIINKIHKCEDMEKMEFIEAIDDETIIFKCIWSDIPLDVSDIIQASEYKIYDEERYMIINGETFTEYEGDRFIDKETKVKELDKKYGWDLRRHGDLYRKYLEENDVIAHIMVIKIKPYSLEAIYNEWVEEEKHYHYLTVKDLIKRLEKTDQDAIIALEDREWGGYEPLEYSEEPMHISKRRECPDCHNGCCEHCTGREIFERKYIIL